MAQPFCTPKTGSLGKAVAAVVACRKDCDTVDKMLSPPGVALSQQATVFYTVYKSAMHPVITVQKAPPTVTFNIFGT
jgi:hypothetical protein